MECKPISNGNVILIEPNCVNINNNVVNGIPQYQDMYIFAELTAKSKGRTIIIDGNTNSTKSKKINFIGNNQDNENNNPNYLNFTTNYYDGSTGNGTHYEGFGINNIKIKINSSFIPQVNIQFVDIRGLAFFNQNDSPYRILFDFPPPIFTLTVKGLYGKPITYDLHLVKYTSEFSATNGNFIIDAQFVAMTFAPLTDILFRYVVNTSLIENPESMNPDTNTAPTNTYSLILKLKNLYSAISDKLETDSVNKEYDNILNDIEKIDSILNMVSPLVIKENEILKTAAETPYLIMNEPDNYVELPETNSIPKDRLIEIDNLIEYNEKIKSEQSSGVKDNIIFKLLIGYVVANNIEVNDNTKTPDQNTPLLNYFEYDSENDSNFETPLLKYKELLLTEKSLITSIDITADDIIDPTSFLNLEDIRTKTKTNTKYYCIDISNFYYKLYKRKVELEKNKNTLSVELTTKINAMVEERLGMIPSIYNIFEIILNDVDAFFAKMKSTSIASYMSHNIPINKKLIIGDNSYSENKKDVVDVYPFPLIINSLYDREERVAPTLLQKKVEFPELDLVNDFIDTFSLQKEFNEQVNLRENQNDDGSYKWIPISPFDSTLGGAVPESPYLGISNNVTTETLKILLKRFYMLSQGTLSKEFYPEDDNWMTNRRNVIRSKAYQNLYAYSEAINLVSTLTSEKSLEAIDVMTDKYKNSIESFYTDIEKITDVYNVDSNEETSGFLYSFPKNDPKYFLISPTISSEGRVYVNKDNQDFKGVNITNNDINSQVIQKDSNNPIDNFIDDAKSGLIFKGAESFFDFTEENIIYVRDKTRDNLFNKSKKNKINGVATFTRYLTEGEYLDDTVENSDYPGTNNQSDTERQLIAFNKGNISFEPASSSFDGIDLDAGKDIINVWGNQLGKYDTKIINDITGDKRLSSVIILSNFGYTASPFNIYMNSLNSLIFDTPSAIEVPSYYFPYIGALVTAIEDGWDNEIVDFFTTGNGQYLDNRGFYVLADLHDINLYLSEEDKKHFKIEYDSFMRRNSNYDGYITNFERMYNWVHDFGYDDDDKEKFIEAYKYILNSNAKKDSDIKDTNPGQFFNVIRDLIDRRNFVNYSQITFEMSTNYSAGYTSLKDLNENGFKTLSSGDTKTINDNYFISFFRRLRTLIDYKKNKAKEEAEEFKKIRGDKDIINQLYYSFKNINDKWLTGNNDSSLYPFSKGKKLIDMFAFVDRGMNPIGETILNAEILGDMLDDPNISLFSVLSQLLSLNGFEFFPLQNFLRFDEEGSWEDSFKTYTGGYDNTQRTYFVCMYVGGSSSYPSVSGNGFENDGIIDISKPGVKGFTPTTNNYEENVNQEKNQDFPWRQVRAFRVRFGEQNQSMFTDIKIDSKEYPETNESIQILSRLAGDQNPDAPVPKGQNLYNLYENRSYKATVTGFGNVMIQPTQYFQLENIPLFNGAYIILDVEHNITANKMTTSFSGTKLLKYPVPRVLEAVSIADYEGASGGEAARIALTANLAKNMSPERVGNAKEEGGLESELGIDLSHHNGNVNWKQIKESDVKFVFIKLTEGMTYYDGNNQDYDLDKNISDALANDIIVSYYHFARFGRTSNPTTDGIDDATNFITHLNNLSGLYEKPKLPVVLDLEEDCFNTGSDYKWGSISNPNESINEYTKAFIDEMEANDYNVMIYCRTDLIEKWNLNNYSKYPFWVARYMDLRLSNPETDEPTVPKEWKDGWHAWQFTPAGSVKGIGGDVDLNVMKKDFIKNHIA